eukprot:6745131-Alexandrium_andersonii.AAC.2
MSHTVCRCVVSVAVCHCVSVCVTVCPGFSSFGLQTALLADCQRGSQRLAVPICHAGPRLRRAELRLRAACQWCFAKNSPTGDVLGPLRQ